MSPRIAVAATTYNRAAMLDGGIIADAHLRLIAISGAPERCYAETYGGPQDVDEDAQMFERLRPEYVNRDPACTPELPEALMSEFADFYQATSRVAASMPAMDWPATSGSTLAASRRAMRSWLDVHGR